MGIAVKKDDTVTITIDGDDEEVAASEMKIFFENTL